MFPNHTGDHLGCLLEVKQDQHANKDEATPGSDESSIGANDKTHGNKPDSIKHKDNPG